jgi:hypothetical protein
LKNGKLKMQLELDFIAGGTVSQRWDRRRSRFLPRDKSFDPARYEVVVIPESMAKAFITGHHYSGSYPAARFRVGIMVKPRLGKEFLGGVAVFSVPMQNAVIPKYLGVAANKGVELGRLVLLDNDLLGFNAESWFTTRAFRLLREALPSIRGVVSYADPIARHAEDGSIVKPGHAGTTYRAMNANYLGRSGKSTLIVSRSGQSVSRRTLSKIRNGEIGIEYACRQLVTLGAPTRRPLEDGSQYVTRAIAEGGFRKVQHPGNHVFTWTWK